MSKKLVIRINNLQDLEKGDSYEVVEETTIRWDRVIGVSVFAFLLVIAAIVGLFMVFNSDTPETFEKSIEMVSVEHSFVNEETPVDEVVATLIPKQEVVTEQEIVNEQETVVQQDSLATNETEAVDDAIKAPVVEVSPVETSVAEVPTVEVSIDEDIALPKQAEQTDSPVEFSDPVDIKSEKIVRAQLTNGLSKREPIDKLGGTISMNEQGLIKVFLFTDMNGLKGETLYHEWYLADKRMARVKINVRNNNVSASSSKFIDKYMMGDWKVNVVNHNGDALVSADFVVVP